MGKILGISKIRDRGVITIPKEVREYLKIKEGDEITIVLEEKQILLKRSKTSYEDFDLGE